MKNFFFSSLFFVFLTGCFATTYEVKGSYDMKAASYVNEKGNSSIKGQAFMRQKGGTVVTCAGQNINLFAVTEYSSQRMVILYKNTEKGYLDFVGRSIIKISPEAPDEYFSVKKTTICDAQGNFKFKNLPANKEFFLTTKISWGVDYIPEGGYLMLKVKTIPNETLEVILN
tara:strand:+ start:154 stop:666 length:513 start_codon:yes stop_codon:yes gene_type:complete